MGKLKIDHDIANKDVPKESFIINTKEEDQINWIHTLLLTVPPMFALYGIFTIPANPYTIIWTIIMYFWTGLGITAGYHRLWSHRAYQATYSVRLALCLGGAGAFEGSAKWWCRNHRAHHRYTDTDKDPYNARKGFWYAHLGWMLVKQKANHIGFADISDLQKDPMIRFQHQYYPQIALMVGIIFPTLVAGICWGDFMGGFLFASMLRMVIVHHATFFVNSLAHWWGNKSFSDHHTAFDSVVTAVLTLGEGYHNYHHEFPHDYRNGIRYFHYDPTKWLIRFLSLFRLTFNLQRISPEEIQKSQLQMKQRQIDNQKYKILKETIMTMSEFQNGLQKGQSLVLIDNCVYDVTNFLQEHPGGRQTLLNVVGTDATAVFEGKGAKHSHSTQAYGYLRSMMVAVLDNKNQ